MGHRRGKYLRYCIQLWLNLHAVFDPRSDLYPVIKSYFHIGIVLLTGNIDTVIVMTLLPDDEGYNYFDRTFVGSFFKLGEYV